MEESWIKKNIKNIGVGVMATVGSLAIHENVEAKKPKEDNFKNLTEQMVTDSMAKLAENLLAEKKIVSVDSLDESGLSNVYYGKVGKYEIEFYDKNRNEKFDGDEERFSIDYEDENGIKFILEKDCKGLTAIVFSSEKQINFKKTTLGETEVVLMGHPDDEIIYVRNLTNSEIHKILDDIKLIQLQEKLQK